MSETLMTEPAATAPEGSDASQGEASAPAQASTDQQPLQAQDQQSQSQEEATQSDNDQSKVSDKYGAPEAYEFKMEKEGQYDSDVLEVYSEVAKELNLSQKAAQELLDKVGSKIQQRTEQNQQAYMQQVQKEWIEQSTTDKEFGGENLQANLSIAKKSLDQFGTPELRQLINETGLGNHPEFIRFMFRTGKAISEDGFVGKSQGGKGAPKSYSDFGNLLYPSQQSQH